MKDILSCAAAANNWALETGHSGGNPQDWRPQNAAAKSRASAPDGRRPREAGGRVGNSRAPKARGRFDRRFVAGRRSIM